MCQSCQVGLGNHPQREERMRMGWSLARKDHCSRYNQGGNMIPEN